MFLRCSKGPIGQYLNQLNCQNYWTLHWTTRSLVFLTSNWGLSQPRGVFDLAKKSQNYLFSGLQWYRQLVWCRNWPMGPFEPLRNITGQIWGNFKTPPIEALMGQIENYTNQRGNIIFLIPRTKVFYFSYNWIYKRGFAFGKHSRVLYAFLVGPPCTLQYRHFASVSLLQLQVCPDMFVPSPCLLCHIYSNVVCSAKCFL